MNPKKTIKIASLNLWRFNEWDRRLPLIIDTIKKLDPDILFLQEVQKDIRYSEKNQLEILNDSLDYPYSAFTIADIKTTRKGIPLPFPVDHGLAVLSKFEFVSEKVLLNKSLGDKEQRILQINNFNIEGHMYVFANIHFSNSDEWAEKHFKESLSLLKGKNTGIIGDFNIKNIGKYSELYKDSYISSSDIYDYISYPKDCLSYDYMLMPKGYVFQSFECLETSISDHRMIIATVQI
jgi:endonuclease/exonuclease/phosphatase family metal-dependent hydrolase